MSDADVSTESIYAQASRLTGTYWVANAMEMFERLAYYGLRTVLPIYMVLAVELGGPQFDHIQKGAIYAVWAAVQSFVPVFSGGYADRYGYKLTVAISIAVKVAGYLLMAFAVDVAAGLTGGVSAVTPGHAVTFWVFLAGACLLALGTAVFKPGLQGIIATQVDAGNSSFAWAVFYQLVNVGGFLGPFLAGIMRLLAWKWVFVSCALIVCLNYVLLLVFPEPDKEEGAQTEGNPLTVLLDSLAGFVEPRLFAFLAVFSGFWAMFYQLFDLLPNFIDDWVDSSAVLSTVGAPLFALFGSAPPEAWGGQLPQEYMINLNAGLIMLTAFAVGALTARVRSMTAMILGILVSAVGILLLGSSMAGWATLGAIAIFSFGEMMASPTKMRYVAGIAPPGKQGLYLGYVNATTGIGWTLGSIVAGSMYQEQGDRTVLARRHLEQAVGMEAPAVAELPKTEVLPTLAAELGLDARATIELLWTTYDPQGVWTWFAWVGVASMLGLVAFDRITRFDLAARREEAALILLTGVVTAACYTWAVGVVLGGLMAIRYAAVGALGEGTGDRVGGVATSVALVAFVAWTLWTSVS